MKNRRYTILAIVGTLAVSVGATAATARAQGYETVRAPLIGFSETPANSTTGHGEFNATIEGDSIVFSLTYQDLAGSATAAHIHFGQKNVAGGVAAFLCGGSKPACPASGTVSGTLVASDIVGPAGQGISAGDFEAVVQAIEAGVTYVNVHSTKFPGGEIRGQVGSS